MPDQFPLLVAEIANTHAGDKEYLIEIVNQLSKTQVNAVKVQLIFAGELLTPHHSMYPIFKSFEFHRELWLDIASILKNRGKQIACDVFGQLSLELSAELGADFIKIHATDFANINLVQEVIALGKPLFLGTGGALESEIDTIMSLVENIPVCLQTGFQAYPTALADCNINRIEYLKKRYNSKVSYADHVDGNSDWAKLLPCLAISKGASSIEKHVKLNDRETKYDWQAALTVEEIANLAVRLDETILVDGQANLKLSSSELEYRQKVRKQLVSVSHYKSGDTLNVEDIRLLRAENVNGGSALTIEDIKTFVGKRFMFEVDKYEVLTKEMFIS